MVPIESVSDFVGLKQYMVAKQNIACEIRALSELLKKFPVERKVEECRQLMVKLAEDRFILAVVGQFKRGKSSLMNAIIGQDLLPTGVLPLTSAITVLKHGPQKRLTVLRQGSLYPEKVPISSLADYVTEKGNPENVKKVISAFLELPVPFLRRGVEFVDTPGIGSVIEANTATTYDFLPCSDAVIFVTSVDTPLTRTETDFLKSIREYVRKVFFVVNKIDLAADSQRREILEFISGRLNQQIAAEEIRIYPVSSKLALESKLAGNEEGFEQSGVKALQESLSGFLSKEKSNILLISILDKALRIATEAHNELTLLKMAGETFGEEYQKKMADLKQQFETLREARAKSLREARERVILRVKEQISAEINPFLIDEARMLLEEFNVTFSRSRWKLSIIFAQNFAKQILPRFKQNLAEWAKKSTNQLNSGIFDVLRQEWLKLEQDLMKISTVAGEVLGGFGMEAPDGESSEFPGLLEQMRPSFGNVEWGFKVPTLQACLPVFVVRSLLKRRFIMEIENFIHILEKNIESFILKRVNEALSRIGSEIEKRAEEIESLIKQAMKGKRLTTGIDGRRQTLELDMTKLSREIETIEAIKKKLGQIRSKILEGESISVGKPSGTIVQPTDPLLLSASEQKILERSLKAADGSWVETDFSCDLDTRGCSVCDKMIDAATGFFASWQYALATQEHAQRMQAALLGFCPLHTWQLEAMASPAGLSQGFPSLMERLSGDLSQLAMSKNSNPGESVLSLVQNSRRCKVCRLLKDTEKNYLNSLAGFIQSPEGRKVYTNSQGLCLVHLGLLISIIPSKKVVQFLLEHAARLFDQISEDMQNYALKRDALRRYTQNLDEEDAYLRGLIHSVGARKVCFPWELDA